jgi:predicted ester cyclase
MTEEDDRVVAKMRFGGSHAGELLGYAPTGRRVSWHGSAHFKFRDGLVEDLWVLGDVDGLRRELESNQESGRDQADAGPSSAFNEP